MGFYIRKSVKAGPFRFNLSKSGVGVSAGVPGFRVGSGPRGNYVHLGRGGVYYRSTLGAGGGASPQQPEEAWVPPTPPPSAEVALEDLTGASAAALVPTGSDDLVAQLNSAASKVRAFRWVAGALLLVLAAQPVVGAILLIAGIPGLVWLWFNDQARRSVVAFYDVNDAALSWFQRLVDTCGQLHTMQRMWRVNAAGNVGSTYQYKVNAGATTIEARVGAAVSAQAPKVLQTNIEVPTISSQRAALHFLPDRILIREGKRFSDVPYASLRSECAPVRFIESERPPRDATQVGTTWQYVNVDGGPDRRFKDNRQLPVMQYGEMHLSSEQGLSWFLQCSQPALAEELVAALRAAPANVSEVTAGPAGSSAPELEPESEET